MPHGGRMDEQAGGDEAEADSSDLLEGRQTKRGATDWGALVRVDMAVYPHVTDSRRLCDVSTGRPGGLAGPRPSGGQWQCQRPWRGHGHVASGMARCRNGCRGGAVHMRPRGHGPWMGWDGMGLEHGERARGCVGACWEPSLSAHVHQQNEPPWLGVYASMFRGIAVKESRHLLLCTTLSTVCASAPCTCAAVLTCTATHSHRPQGCRAAAACRHAKTGTKCLSPRPHSAIFHTIMPLHSLHPPTQSASISFRFSPPQAATLGPDKQQPPRRRPRPRHHVLRPCGRPALAA